MPSGSSFFSKQAISANSKWFAYAGDSHVYFYSPQTFSLEKILPFCETSVTHIALNQSQPDLIACLLMDMSVEVWDFGKEVRVLKH